MGIAVGYDLANSVTTQGDEEGRGHGLGDRVRDDTGNEYVYVQADGAIVAGDVVVISEAFQADQIDTTNSATSLGNAVGVALFAFADNEYGFVQIYGPVSAMNVGTSAAVGARLNSTATAGRVDDDATVGAEQIAGLYTTAAEASNSAAAILNYPFVESTL